MNNIYIYIYTLEAVILYTTTATTTMCMCIYIYIYIHTAVFKSFKPANKPINMQASSTIYGWTLLRTFYAPASCLLRGTRTSPSCTR